MLSYSGLVNSLRLLNSKINRKVIINRMVKSEADSSASKRFLGGRRIIKTKKVDSAPVAENSENRPGWVTVKLGTDEDIQRAKMEERIKDAERWVSKKLTDDEAAILNRAMGIEKEVMSAMEGIKNTPSKQKKAPTKDSILSMEKNTQMSRIKGFLELNPYVCSGCGVAFQSKTAESPGYLTKEKLQDHLQNAAKIRDKQEAIKILEMAGIDIESPVAEDILKAAKVSPEVIAGIKILGSSGDDIEEDNDEDDDMIDENDEDDKDVLDGLEIDLEEILSQLDTTSGISVADAMSNSIQKAIATSSSSIEIKDKSIQQKSNIFDIESKKQNQHHLLDNIPMNDITDEIKSANNNNNKKQLSPKNIFPYEDNINTKDLQPIHKRSSMRSEITAGLDPVCICQRCYRLQQYGQVEENLRPGWSKHELLTPERFELLLGGIKDTDAVVLCLMDIFDLHGSLLANLKRIAGSNPIIIAANKIDILPKDVSHPRLIGWIHETVKDYCDLKSPKEAEEEVKYLMREQGWVRKDRIEAGVLRRQNVHLVSCQTGFGMDSLLTNVMSQAASHGNKVYVMGAANVGKSSFINRLLESYQNLKGKTGQKRNPVPQATVSNLPGTTLDFIKIRLANDVTMIDTPGLINRGQLTTKVDIRELKDIIPSNPINAVTLRMTEGKCVLIGGFARIELLEGRPIFCTFFISNNVKLHPTDSAKAEEVLQRHTGTLVTPPYTYDRVTEIGPYETKTFEIVGESWKESAQDIVIAGLGWVSVTGPGMCKINVVVPQGTAVTLREPLLPFEAMHSTVKFTGGKLARKSRKPGVKGYGWRA